MEVELSSETQFSKEEEDEIGRSSKSSKTTAEINLSPNLEEWLAIGTAWLGTSQELMSRPFSLT